MYSEVLSRVVTVEEVADAITAVEAYEENMFKVGTDYQRDQLSAAKSRWVGVIEQELEKVEDKVKWLRGLKEALRGMGIVRLEVAIDPSVEMVGKVGEWVKMNVGESTVVQWGVDPRLIGGAKITYGGKWADFSLAVRLEDFWREYERSPQF